MSEVMVGTQKAYINGANSLLHDAQLKMIALEIELVMGYPGAENGMIRDAIKHTFKRIKKTLKDLGGQDA
jgi:hypothetical protein